MSYTHFGKPYVKVGSIHKEALSQVRSFLMQLSEGIDGVGCFGTSGAHNMDNGSVGFDLRLQSLRADYNGKARQMVEDISARHHLPWLADVLLHSEPQYNLFIISPDGEVWAIGW